MKAIIQDKYGSADVLELRDIEQPMVGEKDVLVRVRAAGCGPEVWHLMTGLPYFARATIGLRRPRVGIRGWDVAGTVEDTGPSVGGFEPGDAVMGTVEGSFAELALGRADKLIAISSGPSVHRQMSGIQRNHPFAVQGRVSREPGQLQLHRPFSSG